MDLSKTSTSCMPFWLLSMTSLRSSRCSIASLSSTVAAINSSILLPNKETETGRPKGEKAAKLRFSAPTMGPTRSRIIDDTSVLFMLRRSPSNNCTLINPLCMDGPIRLSTATTICKESSRCSESSSLTSQTTVSM